MVSERTADILTETSSYLLLFFLVFGMSATVDSGSLIAQLKNRKALCIGIIMQFILMPFLGFLVLKILGEKISPNLGIILLVVVSSPGGSYSNWWCSLFNADLALSVAMTALSTLLSTVLLPANLLLYSFWLYGKEKEDSILHAISWKTLLLSLLIVISAISSGFVVSQHYHSETFRRWANNLGSISGLALVFLSFFVSTFTSSKDDEKESSKLWDQNWEFFVGVSLPCVAGLLLANGLSLLSGIKSPERVTLSVECCYQNVGIATSVCFSIFSDEMERAQALCVPIFYGIVEAVVLGLYCLFAWKQGWTKAPSDEKICTMLLTSYELSNDTNSFGSEKKKNLDESKSSSNICTDDSDDTTVASSSTSASSNIAHESIDNSTNQTIKSLSSSAIHHDSNDNSPPEVDLEIGDVNSITSPKTGNKQYSRIDGFGSGLMRRSPHMGQKKEYQCDVTTF